MDLDGSIAELRASVAKVAERVRCLRNEGRALRAAQRQRERALPQSA